MKSRITLGFDTERYYQQQVNAFVERIIPDCPTIIEFGGKPFVDYHASRVLPGYDPDIKAAIVRDVHAETGGIIAMAVHAKDILAAPNGRRPSRRIRGDYGITYDEEALRMTDEARKVHGIAVSAVVITATPQVLSMENADYMDTYLERLSQEFDTVRVLPEIFGYPNIASADVVDSLTQNQPITETDQSLIILSPGGGSGKFSVAITEIAHKLASNVLPNYIKFETFPVFNLPTDHPLNRAFAAATADLGNQIVRLSSGETNYDKDVGNFALLQVLLAEYPHLKTPMAEYEQPTDMGVNVIETGIVDAAIIAQACTEEIHRRIRRYGREVGLGHELMKTLEIAEGLLA